MRIKTTTLLILSVLSLSSWAEFGIEKLPAIETTPGQALDEEVQGEEDPTLLDFVRLAYGALNDVEQGLRIDTCPRARRVDRSHTPSVLHDGNDQPFPVDVISYEYLAELFEDFADERRIPFRYPEDGCYARAHAMTRMLRRRGIASGKVFIEGNLRVETTNSPKGYVQWWYHVAPVVMVRRFGVVRPYVIDPSLFNEPVPVERWYNIQTSHDGARIDQTYFTPQFQFTPGVKRTPQNRYLRENNQDMNSVMKRYRRAQHEREQLRNPDQ